MALSGTAPITVKFTDRSEGDGLRYFWDFGDGETSTQQNPTHVYSIAGTFDVSLLVINNNGENTTVDSVRVTAATRGNGKGGNGKGGNGKGGNGKGGNGRGGNGRGGGSGKGRGY